jgi:hypothetical protein
MGQAEALENIYNYFSILLFGTGGESVTGLAGFSAVLVGGSAGTDARTDGADKTADFSLPV